eukprot:GEMP01010181.1.p1 GENE.GEMP01010181.1~~GEMP01010181.1.p1  ORF type:complete len:301 (+),score=35.59 GEMP01010181.1:71-904(+)
MAIQCDTRLVRETPKKDANAIPPNLDLPPGVITHMSQLTGIGLRPSVFGACSDSALVKAKVLKREELDDEQWIKRRLRHGIDFHKCGRKKQTVEKRRLETNQTFTVLSISGGRTKKIHTSDITAVRKGKASPELERTSTSINPNVCLVLETRKRTYSLILPAEVDRDRVVRGLEKLFNKKSVESTSDSTLPPITEATTDHESKSSAVESKSSAVEPKSSALESTSSAAVSYEEFTTADEVVIVVLPETVPCEPHGKSFLAPVAEALVPDEGTINPVL